MLLAQAALMPANAAEPFTLHGLLNGLVAERGVATTPGLPYGPHPRQRADIYRAAAAIERAPVIVFYYGGGWKDGHRSTYAFVGNALAARGYTTVIPDYRLFPEVTFPGFVDDAAAAYAWARTGIANSCGHARPVIVAGHSAGAYLAAMIALDVARVADGQQPAALISLAGPNAFDPTTWPSTKDIFAPAAGRPDSARPVTFARAKAPPSLILHGAADETVKLYNSRDLASALKAQGNIVEATEYPRIGHAGLVLTLARPLRWRAPTLDDITAFIARHAGGSDPAPMCAPASHDGVTRPSR